MRTTIDRLRTWIVLLGVLLVLALALFFAYARYRVSKIGRDLPQKMGLEIQQSTNNFTISKSSKGRTLFVLHAAKAVQFKGGGKAVLHDVSIELYGTDGVSTDRISGSEFDYDPATKTIRADGSVDILLSDPRSRPAGGANAGVEGTNPKAIHVQTRGLVFNQETQKASTDQELTFLQNGSSGSARGATYDGNNGTLSLTSQVILNTVVDGSPVHVEAQSAGFDRASRQMFLIHQAIQLQQKQGSSDQATIFFRPDGKADHIRAEGHVHFRSDDGSELQASTGTAALGPAGVLQQVVLEGGLLLTSQREEHSLHVNGNTGVFSFVPASTGGAGDQVGTAGRLNHVRLTGAVSAVDQQSALGGNAHASETREMRAGQMDVDLKSGFSNSIQAEHVLASGNAMVTIHTIHADAPQQLTQLKGDQIYSTLADGHSISTLRATGNTSLEQSTPGGLSQSSSGDVLSVNFAQSSAPQPSAARGTRSRRGSTPLDTMSRGSQVETALLTGHAVMVQQQNASANPDKTVATAERISYRGDSGVMELTGGNPHISRGQSDIAASSVVFNHTTGDATATGGVKATYVNRGSSQNDVSKAKLSGANDVTHVVADHAALDHAKDQTTFYGAPLADARMWQGSSSISAPRIVLSRSLQSLVADGGVKAAFAENAATKQGTEPRVIHTTSRIFAYSGGERKATLSGGAQAHEAEGTISAATIDLYLQQEAAGPGDSTVIHAATSALGPGGKISRMIAQQNVRLTQGDRSGTGDKLVYTADDGTFILTGTTAAPPLLSDREHGTVTGSSLVFNDRDDSVVVNRGQSPTLTDSRTKSDPHSKSPAAGSHPAGRVQ